MKTRLIAVALTLCMIISLASCSNTPTDGTSSAADSSQDTSNAPTAAPTAEPIDISGVELINAGTLSIGVEIGYPPFEDFAEDGTTPIGYDVDFAKALGEKLGLEVNFINTAWDGIFQGIDVNYDCVISAVTITEERKETMIFSDPYINNFQAVVVKADYTGEINGFTDLDGMTIALQKETTSDKLMKDYVSTGTIECTISANEKVTTCFTQLTNGEIDAVVVDSTVAAAYLASDPDKYKLAFQDESEPEQFGVAMGMDNTALQTAINKAIEQLEQENYFEDSVEFWFGA
ncbi:MAG: transporter substrate-binding domain-containing protein [Eubacteriales bacterium]|nr:transporter substrate-binding domain-containing protein [Eubacteriales bacterium]